MQCLTQRLEGRGPVGWIQQVHRQGPPKQGYGGGPLVLWKGFQGPKFDQPLAAGCPGRVPELVEADLTAVGVAALVGMEMAQGFADGDALIAGGQAFEHAMGQLQIQPSGTALIGPGRLGGGPHGVARKQVGQAWVVLPVAQDPHQPGRPAEEGVLLQAGTTPEQVVAAAAALGALPLLLPGAQAHGLARFLQGPHPAGVVGPAVAHRQVHFQHAGVGGEPQHLPGPIGIEGQYPTELWLAPGRRNLGNHAQQAFQGLAGQGWQEQAPLLRTHLQGEHLPQHSLGEVGEGQA